MNWCTTICQDRRVASWAVSRTSAAFDDVPYVVQRSMRLAAEDIREAAATAVIQRRPPDWYELPPGLWADRDRLAYVMLGPNVAIVVREPRGKGRSAGTGHMRFSHRWTALAVVVPAPLGERRWADIWRSQERGKTVGGIEVQSPRGIRPHELPRLERRAAKLALRRLSDAR